METTALNIGDVECPRSNLWGISGGSAYRRFLFEALRKRFNVEPMVMLWGQGNGLIQGTRLAYRLLKLKGTKDIWIRGSWFAITLPTDRTVGKNVLLIHHVDTTESSYPI